MHCRDGWIAWLFATLVGAAVGHLATRDTSPVARPICYCAEEDSVDLDSAEKVYDTFYRLLGTDKDDPELTRLGEASNEVADIYLTRGVRRAQRWMLDCGYWGWKKRSAALTWTGTDSADGGQSTTVPTDFLRAAGNERESCLTEANGNRWGQQILPGERDLQGDYFYFQGDKLWLARTAAPPTTVYLEFFYRHPVWSASVTIDFPLEARGLIPAEAANLAKEENWLPGGPEMRVDIERAVSRARDEARHIARLTKEPRRMRRPYYRAGNRW